MAERGRRQRRPSEVSNAQRSGSGGLREEVFLEGSFTGIFIGAPRRNKFFSSPLQFSAKIEEPDVASGSPLKPRKKQARVSTIAEDRVADSKQRVKDN